MGKGFVWTESKVLTTLLMLTCVSLVVDLRFEHNHVVRHNWVAWVPVVYPALIVVAGFFSLARWQTWGRTLMFWLFAAGLVVGVVGFWEHNGSDMFKYIGTVLSVWGGQHPDPQGVPRPILVPLTFSGIGVLGMYVCSRLSLRQAERERIDAEASLPAKEPASVR